MAVTFPSLDAVTVIQLKQRLEEVHGIPVSFQRLIFSGRELTADDSLILSYGMEDGSMVHLLLRQNNVPAGPSGGAPVAPAVDSEGMGWFNGVNIPIQPAADGVGVTEEEAERLVKTVRLSRAIKFVSMISVLCLLILCMKAAPAWMVACVFWLVGWYGAHHFHAQLLLSLFAYIALSVGGRIYFVVTQPSTPEGYVLFALGTVLDLYLGRLTASMYRLCWRLTRGERQDLMSISRPSFQPY